MTQKPTEPLRGDAAWRARRAEIAKANDAAHARALRQRTEHADRLASVRRADERRERASLPVQPTP